MSEPKKGELFSRQYLDSGKPSPDSKRARFRLSAFFEEFLDRKVATAVGRKIELQLGVEVQRGYEARYMLEKFLKDAAIGDVLSTITIIACELHGFGDTKTATVWKNFVQQVFQEENLAYTVDEQGGVHPLVDMEYERNIAATIAGLGIPRYAAARSAFQAAQAKLERTSPDTKGALRDIFESAETLTKLITGSGKALDAGFVRSELEPRIQKHYADDAVAMRSSLKAAHSFGDWIDAVHPYRHGQKAEEPVAPPLELAVLLASQGASFIRWLVDLDTLLTGGGLV